jgi:hypothetical protein
MITDVGSWGSLLAIWVYRPCHQFSTAPSAVEVVDAPLDDRGEERKTLVKALGRDTKLGAISLGSWPAVVGGKVQ